MAHYQEGDLHIISRMMEAGVFKPIDLAGAAVTKGAMLLVCADGDQFLDLYSQICGAVNAAGCERSSRVHVFGWNGAALVIPAGSPLSDGDTWWVKVKAQIEGAMKLKGMTTIFISVHGPCGAAGLVGIKFPAVMVLLEEAVRRVRAEIPGLTVVPIVHLDLEEGKRTLMVDLVEFGAFAAGQYVGSDT